MSKPLTPAQIDAMRALPMGDMPNKLRVAIKLAGITQAELSESIDEQQPYVSDIVRGRWQTITVTKARKFAEFFGCAIEDLFPERESVAP